MNRHGLTSGCTLSAFGDTPTCTPEANETDGLWTALLLAAEAFRAAVTGAPDAIASATTFFQGMQLLNNITGIPGLMARTVLSPTEAHPGGDYWYNATVPGFEGWVWQGNTSSDDVTGHMFGLPIFANVLGGTVADATIAAKLVGEIATYIAEHDYFLIDINGLRTKWGVWNPAFMNTDQFWSDERYVVISASWH